MVVNDFGAFLDEHAAIDRVFVNGAAAEKNFRSSRRRRPVAAFAGCRPRSPAHDHALDGQAGGAGEKRWRD